MRPSSGGTAGRGQGTVVVGEGGWGVSDGGGWFLANRILFCRSSGVARVGL